ncbi:MAG TPA: hypothetical protein VFQ53_01990 [Kofleriaceae bacterium]|nr:hypothetical protein [Kofleriaceae bacterium]
MLLRFALLVSVVGCSLRDPPSPVKPAAPLPADPPVELATMDVECDAMIAALATYKTCHNLETEDREDLDGWIEAANRNLAASRKANPDANSQSAIAAACHKAALSVKTANERCLAGPRPKRDDDVR